MTEEFPSSVRRSILLRSLCIQGSWNYQTLIGTGFAFALLPALRHIHQGDPAALERALARHAALFNSHPYLATVAAGAVARIEADGAPPELVDRFKSALRGSLGSMGDRLVWLVWRPTTLLAGLSLLLIGAPWWLAVGVFLVSYNALHLWLRAWGLDTGLAHGLQVGRALREAPLERIGERGGDAGAVLAGFAAALAVGSGASTPLGHGVGIAGIAVGLALGLRTRPFAIGGLLLALIVESLLARTF